MVRKRVRVRIVKKGLGGDVEIDGWWGVGGREELRPHLCSGPHARYTGAFSERVKAGLKKSILLILSGDHKCSPK